MLRITVAETAVEQRWTVEGRLVGPWVGELRTCWKKRHRAQNGRTCTVDLSGVTFIDRGGQRLLRSMSKEGTQFVATGIYIKHVLDQLKPNGKRGLLKVISCLFGALLGGVIPSLCPVQVTPERPKTNTSQGSTAARNSTIRREGARHPVFSEIEEGAIACQSKLQSG
jgi:ABC-type transporter Mla MlaB component